MSKETDYLKLFKYDKETDDFDTTTFNVQQALNNNWDKIDVEVAKKASVEELGRVQIGDSINVQNGVISADKNSIRTDSSIPLRTEVVSSLSSTAQTGRIAFDSVNKKFKGFNGDKWV
ncbi:hypothetical protein [Clostridium sporogenes]|uniref:hypothetical protein n=1 Tax=Clostridium sporogenes TaxID=1509 RepID=UPI0006B2A163|nr:hypothetical protein [Clostridium sporogenes]KOY67808.1 hypothetical protein AN649_00770 [Clostridium sporogenes]